MYKGFIFYIVSRVKVDLKLRDLDSVIKFKFKYWLEIFGLVYLILGGR